MKTYEGMFLLEAGQPNFEEAVAPIHTIFTRNQVEVLHLKKWDERRLAYEIRGRRRGMYVLAYFKSDPDKITEIERDAQLDEHVLRILILQAEEVSAETMAAQTPAESHGGRVEERERGEDEDREYRPRRRREYGEGRGEERRTPREEHRDRRGKDAEEKPAETPAKTPAETPAKTPAETPAETPAKTPAETPAKTPAETPAKTPAETPAETPADASANEGQNDNAPRE